MRLPVLLSLGIHGVAVGLALWFGLRGAPQEVGVGAVLTVSTERTVFEPEPLVEIELDELVELDEPPPVQPVLPSPEVAEPDETFELDEVEVQQPLPTMDVPLRLARLRVPRKRPPTVQMRPTPPPTPRVATVAVPVRRRAPAPRRATPRPGPMRVVFAPDARHYYPHDARQRGIGGTVSVQIVVDANGVVTSAAVVRSSGDASLDAAATRLVRAYRFTPGAGLRSARLPIAFRLL